MKREFLTTGDGSVTIHLPDWDEQYHSKHGAIAEAIHVFIKSGLDHWIQKHPNPEISILEIGFGTGLNAFLTSEKAILSKLQVKYTAIEAYPVSEQEISQLNYPVLLDASQDNFLKLHKVPWETPSEINQNFNLIKRKQFFSEITDIERYNIIYFDAFGARVQPELWTESIFESMLSALKPGGILVTYAAKGSVRRAMLAVGFTVERLAGPPGKREMLRATKAS